MTAVDPILIEVTEAPISVTVASTGLVLTVATGTVGPAGATGAAGTNGQGVATGGTTGQVLAKASGTNYDTQWVNANAGSGTVTSVTGTAPIAVATGTTTPVVSIAAATTSAAGSMSSTDKSKLDGVATGATANSSDATLLARANHTGTQALSTISDAGTAAAKNAPATGNAAAGEVVLGSDTRLTDARTPSTHAASHGSAGSDAITVAQSQVTGLSASLSAKLDASDPSVTNTRTPTDGSVSTAKIADSAVTSAKIADGTIVNADISASAAIATSKISGLATVATSGSATDLSGTVPTARLGTGTASANTFLRGDQTYQPVPVGNNDLGRVSNACYLTGSGASFGGATSGNTMTTPDIGTLDITGDIEIVARVNFASYASGAQYIAGKWSGTAADQSYYFQVTNAGNLGLVWVDSGGTTKSVGATANPASLVGGTAYWLKATLTVNNGASGNDARFYYAADSSSEPSSWTQYGTTTTTAGTTSIRAGSGQLSIGGLTGVTAGLTGTIYQVILRDVIGGTPVFNANFANATADALTFTPAVGGTITVTSTRYAYGIPNAQLASQATFSASANTVYYAPFEVTAPLTVDAMAYSIAVTQAAGGNVRMGIYAADSNLQPTGAPLFDSGDAPFTTSTTGAVLKQGTAVTLQPGVYLSAFNTSAAITQVRSPVGGIATLNTTLGGSMFTHTLSVAQTQGAFPSPGTAWTARGTSGTGTVHLAVMRWRSA